LIRVTPKREENREEKKKKPMSGSIDRLRGKSIKYIFSFDKTEAAGQTDDNTRENAWRRKGEGKERLGQDYRGQESREESKSRKKPHAIIRPYKKVERHMRGIGHDPGKGLCSRKDQGKR